MMPSIRHLLFLIFPVIVIAELHDYEQLRRLTPADYMEQFDLIVDDLNVAEEETNRKLIVLASHFDEQHEFRNKLVKNAKILDHIYETFLEVTQRIKDAKYRAQAILANRTRTAKEQHKAAVILDKQYPLEMSVLLDICETLGFTGPNDIIKQSLENPPKIKQLARDLEEYTEEAYQKGYLIAQELHQKRYVSRRSQLDARNTFVNKYPKAMAVHDFTMNVLVDASRLKSIIDSQ